MALFRFGRLAPPIVALSPKAAEDGAPEFDASAIVGLAHLWAIQFQHIASLALAGGGGLLVLTQTGLVTVSGRWWVALVLFAVAALLSMLGQNAVVEDASRGKLPGSGARSFVILAMMCFGGSAYLLVRLLMAG